MNKDRRTPMENNMRGNMCGGSDLLEEIRALSFVKAELELYLDTHPGCHTALDYYHKTVEALEELMTRYQYEVGPLRAEGVMSNDSWTWVKEPWPWQAGNGAVNERGER